ncbi:Nucleoporin POM33 [Candida viswanathii]|uniref:Nucleoporin POM33 n=1 Tax=Candida viswanathii TaxID=5486 RepID=A0A367XPQ4_9ASCO|nr:Nucleoporin POM33 [Candida viswanathii]
MSSSEQAQPQQPSGSANLRYQPPLEVLTNLLKTQQFYWFLGHVLAVLFFVLNFVTGFFRPRSSLRYYQFSLLSIILTYLIVIRQIHFKTGFKVSTFNARLLRDENVQYLTLAVVLYLSSFVIGQTQASLYSFVIFAVFHVLTYFQNHLLSVFLPSIGAQQRVNSLITQFVHKFNQPALFLATNAEIMSLLFSGFQLIPSALFLLFKWNLKYFLVQVLVFVVLVAFNKLRYDGNHYTKTVVELMDARANQFVVQVNNPQLSELYHKIRTNVVNFLGLIQLPKEAAKQK